MNKIYSKNIEMDNIKEHPPDDYLSFMKKEFSES
jgi:hypothetical protein